MPLRQLVNKSESYLLARGVKDAGDKYKDEKNKTKENLARLKNIRIWISKAMAERNTPQIVLLTSRINILTRKYKTGKSM